MELCLGCSHQRLDPRNPVFKNSGNVDISLATGRCNGRRSFARAVVQPQPYSWHGVVPALLFTDDNSRSGQGITVKGRIMSLSSCSMMWQ